ncbi:MAG TPA: hypothetical protein VF590_20745, partial [Isosphaeraceae bacterium]
MTPRACRLLIVVAVGLGPLPVEAGVMDRAARATAERVARLLGKEAGRAGTEALTRRIEVQAARYGDEAVRAVRKAGPGALRLIQEAGPHGEEVARLLARRGEAATWMAASPRRLALVRTHGDEAARALLRHRQVAEPALAAFGRPAARALAAVGPRDGRRLAMMVEGGEMARTGYARELLEVVGRYGDRAMGFVWRHKAALAVSAVLVAFLADPGPFLAGTRELAYVTGEAAARPVLSIPARVAAEIVRRTDRVAPAVVLLGIAAIGLSLGRRWRRRADPGPVEDSAHGPVRRLPDSPLEAVSNPTRQRGRPRKNPRWRVGLVCWDEVGKLFPACSLTQ